MTSQHNASPSGVAPYATKSRRRQFFFIFFIFFVVADLFATGVRRSQCRKERLQLHAVFFARSASSTPESKAAAHWCGGRRLATGGASSKRVEKRTSLSRG